MVVVFLGVALVVGGAVLGIYYLVGDGHKKDIEPLRDANGISRRTGDHGVSVGDDEWCGFF